MYRTAKRKARRELEAKTMKANFQLEVKATDAKLQLRLAELDVKKKIELVKKDDEADQMRQINHYNRRHRAQGCPS